MDVDNNNISRNSLYYLLLIKIRLVFAILKFEVNDFFLGKRKKSDIGSAIMESRTISEEGKKRRHEERMDFKLKLMEKLDKILEKI